MTPINWVQLATLVFLCVLVIVALAVVVSMTWHDYQDEARRRRDG